MRVIVDSSVLIRCVEAGRDILALIADRLGEPVEALTTRAVREELSSLAGRGDRRARYAAAARGLAEGMEVIGEKTQGSVDEQLVELSKRLGIPVATADAGLLERLRSSGCRAIYISPTNEVKLFV